ncbi:MAG: hypothetical protein KDI68_07240 [Gammaproteobacteria bacterium]|nr:hypothetical protein [Gammaproteobacteria bacterium]
MALALLFGAWLATAAAEQRPAPRGMFEAQGVMNYVDLAAAQIIIDNRSYLLARNASWYGVDDAVSLQSQLFGAIDRPIAYVTDASAKTPTVTAVWLIPAEGR